MPKNGTTVHTFTEYTAAYARDKNSNMHIDPAATYLLTTTPRANFESDLFLA